MNKYNVILEDTGQSSVKIVSFYKKMAGVDLKTANEKIRSVPCVLFENLTEEEAKRIALQLKGEGAKSRIELRETNDEEASSISQEYEYVHNDNKVSNKSKKIEDTTLNILEKISRIITCVVGVAAFLLLMLDYSGLEGLTNGLTKIFTYLFIACLLWFLLGKRYVTYLLEQMENEVLYADKEYNSIELYELLKEKLRYDGVEKIKLENEQCVVECKFGIHNLVYDPDCTKIFVSYDYKGKFPSYLELCNMVEANCIAKNLKDALYGTEDAEAEKKQIDKLYRLHRLGKLTPLYIIVGILLLIGPKEIKKGIETLRYPEIVTVQEGSIPILGDADVKTVLENFFGEPKWRYEKEDDKTGYVVFSGTAIENSTNMVRDFEIYFHTKRINDEEIQYEVQLMTLEGEEVSEADMLGMLLMVNEEYTPDNETASDLSYEETVIEEAVVEGEKEVLHLEEFIVLGQTADEMAELMNAGGYDVVYLEEYDACGFADARLRISNYDVGLCITALPSETATIWFGDVNTDMSLEEADWQLINSMGAENISAPDDNAWRYKIDEIYYFTMYGEGEDRISFVLEIFWNNY